MPKRVTDTDEAPKRNGPSDDDFAGFLARDIEIGSQIARLNAARGTNMARYENLGGDPEKIRIGRRLDRDGVSYLHLVTDTARMMGQIEVDKKGQANFLAAIDPEKQRKEKATLGPMVVRMAQADSDGWNSGFAGGSDEGNPFQPVTAENSMLNQTWAKAFRDGAEARIEKLKAKGKPTGEDVNTSRQRPPTPEGQPKPETPRRGRRTAAQAAPSVDAATGTADDQSALGAAVAALGPEKTQEIVNEALRPGWQGDRDVTMPDDAVQFPVEARRPRRQALH